MTEEKLAEESLVSYRKEPKWAGKMFMKDENTCYTDGFLAGLKAGRPQWHDLRKDTNDLPKFRRDILVTCEYRSKLKKKRETFEWDYKSDMPLHTIAWCEIPTFDKE